ncbi:MAG TPA: DUF2062 domain-containing protein [Desulfobulbaceae bacterium]|nr:DUF2062 domain-containing protein [Desulfobulbaceae bacterium]
MSFSLTRTVKFYAMKFKRLRGDPRSLALGTAIGVFIGISPTIPLHTVGIIGVTLLLRVSTIAALISATVVSNPLTMGPLYYLCWLVGDLILPGRLTWDRILVVLDTLKSSGFIDSLKSVSQLGANAIMVLLSGWLILGLPLAVASYFLSLRFFIAVREKRRRKHLLD